MWQISAELLAQQKKQKTDATSVQFRNATLAASPFPSLSIVWLHWSDTSPNIFRLQLASVPMFVVDDAAAAHSMYSYCTALWLAIIFIIAAAAECTIAQCNMCAFLNVNTTSLSLFLSLSVFSAYVWMLTLHRLQSSTFIGGGLLTSVQSCVKLWGKKISLKQRKGKERGALQLPPPPSHHPFSK